MRISKNNNILTLLISGAIIVILLLSSSLFQVLNKTLQSSYYNVRSELLWFQAHPNIIVVELDNESIDAIWSFPFPRSVYSELITNLETYSPAVIAFDMLFLDRSLSDEDNKFVRSIENSWKIVLWSAIDKQGKIQSPLSLFSQAWAWQWYLSPNIESSSKTVYSFSPQITDTSGRIQEHFTLSILRKFHNYLYGSSPDDLWEYTSSSYDFSPLASFPLASSGREEILINYIPWDSFQSISLRDIYDAQKIREVSKTVNFRDAILLIGPAADGLWDEFYTPNGVEYGVYIHANILSTLLSGQYMIYFEKVLEWFLIFLLIILSVSVNLSRSRSILILWNIAIVSIFWFIFPISILLGTNLILNYPSEIIFSLLLSALWANIVKFIIEDTNKKKLWSALSEYVSSNITLEILSENGDINLDGEKRDLVCLFSDIEWFTSLSEKLSPEKLVAFLRDYLTQMTSSIMQFEGHVDKFEWDAIMSLWWAFKDHKTQDYILACTTALDQLNLLENINASWKVELWKLISVRIWIHGWDAIVWNIGAVWKKMDFTALGDNVNLASRLEGVNKYYGTHICVSHEVYTHAKDDFEFRFLDEITVKWKDIPVKIYELQGKKWELSEQQLFLNREFEEARDFYTQRDFSIAVKIFEKLSQGWDTPSTTYLKRCKKFIMSPPKEDWKWIWNMSEK